LKQTISDVWSQASEDKEVFDWSFKQRVHFLQLCIIHLAHLVHKKKDDSLRFCVNYRKFNALIKRDYCSLSLINETFACIQESKYLTRLNIIVTFNKLRMHLDNKDLTIFIIFFDSYKYHVMLFELINESTFY